MIDFPHSKTVMDQIIQLKSSGKVSDFVNNKAQRNEKAPPKEVLWGWSK